MTNRLVQYAVFLCLLFSGNHVHSQGTAINRIITVRDGLPQSYVSGICQDDNGFLWISTLNGLCRYDGMNFKYYWHGSSDTTGLSGNIILRMLNFGNRQLLLCYADGKIDLLHTATEKITHLGGAKSFSSFKPEIGFLRTLVTDGEGFCWMVTRDGGLLELDIHHNILTQFSATDLMLHEPVLGLSTYKHQLLLVTRSQLLIGSKQGKSFKAYSYPFGKLKLFDQDLDNIYSVQARPGNMMIMADAKGMIVWDLNTDRYQKLRLPRENGPGVLISASDDTGNFFFDHKGSICQLNTNNALTNWAPASSSMKGGATVMYIDRSGVLWVGTNGYGLRQYNLKRTGMAGFENRGSFTVDVLGHFGLQASVASKTFLKSSVPFANRTATGKDGIWIADRYHFTAEPELIWQDADKLMVHRFECVDSFRRKQTYGIQFLTFDKHECLWGVDQHFHVLKFNTQNFTFQNAATLDLKPDEDINGMVAEDENILYISSTRNLIRMDMRTGNVQSLVTHLPSRDLLTIAADPGNKDVLWIGTLSDGLIKYYKTTGKTQVFNMKTGLPNNTVYAILPGSDGQLWCSSNKGIFSFQPQTGDVRSFTSRDGLLDDEFNRYYAMMLPGSNLAFGGPLGYTIFDPSTVARDEFNPMVNLTSLTVSNLEAFDKPLSQLTGLSLNHSQNFITAEFAAMQFDAPDKTRYRYMLEGFDKEWVIAGNQPKATYTSLPPGNYNLLLNASNTSGKWSSYIVHLSISISPPFWRTWWFLLIGIATAAMLIFAFVHLRIRRIKKIHTQRLHFERQAMHLHAVSLRARMNPHFIFNCLNSIKALIQENQNKNAVRYLTSFVSLIRKQLNNTKDEISLTDELQTCKLYLEMEAMRFEGRINYHFDIREGNLNHVLIPPLTLQPLIENSIIHGLLPKEDGGTVNIRVFDDGHYIVCEIEDDGIGRKAAFRLREKSSRLHEPVGVQLLEERIALYDHLNSRVTSFETVDLVSSQGEPCGTLVTIKLKKQL